MILLGLSQELEFGSVGLYKHHDKSALDHINTALKFDSQADKLEFFVKALRRDPNGKRTQPEKWSQLRSRF